MNRLRRWLTGMSIVQSCAWGALVGLAVTVGIAAARATAPLNIGAAAVGILTAIIIVQSLEKW